MEKGQLPSPFSGCRLSPVKKTIWSAGPEPRAQRRTSSPSEQHCSLPSRPQGPLPALLAPTLELSPRSLYRCPGRGTWAIIVLTKLGTLSLSLTNTEFTSTPLLPPTTQTQALTSYPGGHGILVLPRIHLYWWPERIHV